MATDAGAPQPIVKVLIKLLLTSRPWQTSNMVRFAKIVNVEILKSLPS